MERLRTRLRVDADVDWQSALHEELLALSARTWTEPGRLTTGRSTGRDHGGRRQRNGERPRPPASSLESSWPTATLWCSAPPTPSGQPPPISYRHGATGWVRGSCGPEASDPAAVAFDAVAEANAEQADCVVIDTAGRLHTKVGLMDELGKIKRVINKQGPVDEVLLVLDATTGQNGLAQAGLQRGRRCDRWS